MFIWADVLVDGKWEVHEDIDLKQWEGSMLYEIIDITHDHWLIYDIL